jgi:hypothetical protein
MSASVDMDPQAGREPSGTHLRDSDQEKFLKRFHNIRKTNDPQPDPYAVSRGVFSSIPI